MYFAVGFYLLLPPKAERFYFPAPYQRCLDNCFSFCNFRACFAYRDLSIRLLSTRLVDAYERELSQETRISNHPYDVVNVGCTFSQLIWGTGGARAY